MVRSATKVAEFLHEKLDHLVSTTYKLEIIMKKENIFQKKLNRLNWSNMAAFFPLSMLCAAWMLWGGTLSAKPKPAGGLSIEKITIGEEIIAAGRKQLVELLLKNRTKHDKAIVVKLLVTLPNHNIITFGAKRVMAKSKTETRVLIPYPIPKHREGDYIVATRIYTRNGKVLIRSITAQNKLFFVYDATKRKKIPTKRERKPIGKNIEKEEKKSKTKAPAMLFEPPDLKFQEITIINNNSVLRGESTNVRLILTNDGGDVATDVEYSVYWYFVHRPKRKVKVELGDTRFKIIAPGEKKIIQLPLTIPDTELTGHYIIQGVVDEANYIKESNEENNIKESNKPLIFSDIALVFPEDSHSFAEDGRFIFQWRSLRYNQFKVQISLDEFFPNTKDTFELPKGEKWESSKVIKPLEGEIKMAINMMEANATDHLYWRVKAKNSQGELTESSARKFLINLKADLK